MLTFDKAYETLKSLGIECNREQEYRKRPANVSSQGKMGTHDPHDLNLFRDVYLPLSPEMWCNLLMADGEDYVGGCCATMSNLQDLIESVFRFNSGWISCTQLEEISLIIIGHGDFDGKVRWGRLSDDQVIELTNEWQNSEGGEFSSWDRIALCWHLVRDNYGPEVPKAYHASISEVDKAVSLLREGLTILSWDHLRDKSIADPQWAGNHLITLARIVPALKTLYECVEELSPGDFEGVALFDKQIGSQGVEAIASNRMGLCIFQHREDAETMMNLWRKQDAEYKEERKDPPIDERIEIRPIRVSMSKGLELITCL